MTVPPPLFGPEAWAPLAAALEAYQSGARDVVLGVLVDEGEADPIPVSLFFREGGRLRPGDREALSLARGRVLDAGAGVGAVTLLLQERGFEVTAVEVIPEAVRIMRERGVRRPLQARLEDLPPERAFDTILLLMNGSSLAGTFRGLRPFLRTLAGLLAPGGQVLMESTDPWVGGQRPGLPWVDPPDVHRPAQEWEGALEWEGEEYPGEVQFQLEFRGRRGAPFPQLFLDSPTLFAVASEEGWSGEVVAEWESGGYLARLVRRVGGT